MTIDLSKVKPGDTVVFRCGGEAVVDYIDEGRGSYRYGISYKGSRVGHPFEENERYLKCGSLHGIATKHPFDIIEIKPKPFDWDEVKPGMAFYAGPHHNGSKTYYRYIKPSSNEDRVFCDTGVGSYGSPLKSELKRLPEHDITIEGA